ALVPLETESLLGQHASAGVHDLVGQASRTFGAVGVDPGADHRDGRNARIEGTLLDDAVEPVGEAADLGPADPYQKGGDTGSGCQDILVRRARGRAVYRSRDRQPAPGVDQGGSGFAVEEADVITLVIDADHPDTG